MLAGRHVLIIIGGGIAAYKVLDLIRRLRERGVRVTPVLTRAGARFVTPLSVSALCGVAVQEDLFDLTAEAEMGHIELSRAADLVVVAPATADLMGRMAAGLADDLYAPLGFCRREPSHYFIEQKKPRLGGEGARQFQPALLRRGQFVGLNLARVCETGEFQDFPRRRPCRSGTRMANEGTDHDVLDDLH